MSGYTFNVYIIQVVAPLLEAVKSEYPAIQGLVLKVLYLVCQEECVRVAMGEANGLESLLAFLKDEEMKDLHKGMNIAHLPV